MGDSVPVVPRLLLIAAYFPPSRKIGARRPDRFARGLAERGWDVTVLTLHPRYARPCDDAWRPARGVTIVRTHAFVPGNLLRGAASAVHRLNAADADARVPRTGPGDRGGSPFATRDARRSGILGQASDAVWRGLARLEFPDRWVGWIPFAALSAGRARYDAVLASLPPYTPALIARRIARRSGAVLALDYRDPWTEAPRVDWNPAHYAHLLERHRRLEDACLQDSDVIFATSPTICGWLAPRAGIQPVFAPNSFDARQSTRAKGARTLVYAGSLAYGRSLQPVLEAMARLADFPDGCELRLVYAGGEGRRVVEQAEALGLAGRVEDLGNVSSGDSDRLLREALAAIVLVTPGYEYMVPGKVFQVIASGTPMLLVAPEGADASVLCRDHRLGWRHTPADVAGIAASLRRALAGEVPDPVKLDRLRTDFVVSEVDRALRAATGRGPRAAAR